MSKGRKRFDFCVILLLLVVAVAATLVFMKPIPVPDYDLGAAERPVKLEFNGFKRECSLVDLVSGYHEPILVLKDRYDGYQLRYIHDNILEGTQVRHVLMETIPEYVFELAFCGVEGVTVYTDQQITEDMKWAKHVTVRSLADREALIHPTYDLPFYFDFSVERVKEAVQEWAGSEQVMLNTTVPFALVIIGLCLLRQKVGFPNPLWPIFRPCLGKMLFSIAVVLTGIVVGVALFCEAAELEVFEDSGWDLYVITEFVLDVPVKILAVLHGLFLLWDLFRRDFPWFIARWVVRAAIVLLAIIAFAIAGWILGSVVAANLGLVKLLWFLCLLMFLVTIFGGGTVIDRSAKAKMRPYTVISEDGSSVRVDSYTHGIYVGNDLIVGEGSDSMTGESGRIYKKF